MAIMDFFPQFKDNAQDVSGIPANDAMAQLELQRKLKMADALKNAEMPQGQMISGHYVAPSWTQQLASAYGAYKGKKAEEEALKGYGEYNKAKEQRMADALKQYEQDIAPRTEQAPQQPTTIQGSTGEISPNMGMVNAPPRITPATAGDRYSALLKFGTATQNPELTQKAMFGNIEHLNKVEDRVADQEFQRIMQKDRQGFELTQGEKNFANQMALQKSNQQFQSGENKLNREQQVNLQPLVQVMGADGKPTYIERNKAIGMQPYSAAQEAKDVAKVQNQKQAEISAQQVLDQAQGLFMHPGRTAATGLSSWRSSIPGTEAKDFKANLETFKAQTFVPMVQALKGMGALSDAEGRKLTESVGTFDTSVSEEAFTKNLAKATQTLYDKARVAGLNVQRPQFLDILGNSAVGAEQGGWKIERAN